MRRFWYNGTVASADGAMCRYGAMGAEDGRLTFSGSVQEALTQAWDETRDSQEGMVLPGLTDSCMHLLHYAMIQRSLPLFGMVSIRETIERGRTRIERDHPSYLISTGQNQETMVGGHLVAREDLGRISTDAPVCMLRTRLHIGAYNPVILECIRALEDAASGMLALMDFSNGTLREDATHLYMKVLPQAGGACVKELIRLDQRGLDAADITCVNSDGLKAIVGVDPVRLIGILREVEADGELTVRVYERYLAEPEDFERLQAVRGDPVDRENLFHTGPRKLFQDGSLGVKSAETIDGYLDEPDNHDIPIYTEEKLCNQIRAAHTAHINAVVHAIDDLVFRKVYDVIEWVEWGEPWPDHRHGIVHARATTPVLLEQIKALGLQAYIRPIFIGADMSIIAERVGEAHVEECYSWKTVEDLDIRVGGGSDCPVESFSVSDNLRAAVARQSRAGTKVYLSEQALTVGQAVWLLTSDVVWASRDEAIYGTLELGKQADLVMLNRDLFKIFHQDFNRAKVLEMALNGVTAYRAETSWSVHNLDHRQ